jgi:hypothetical protein
VPRAGSVASGDAAASGAAAASERKSVAGLRGSPLRASGSGRAGAAAVDPDRASASMVGRGAAVAKGIVSDKNQTGGCTGWRRVHSAEVGPPEWWLKAGNRQC